MNNLKQKGASTVEFAMLLPLLLLLVVMVSEFGVMFYRLNAVTKSVQVAARYLSDNNTTPPPDKATARNLAVYGKTTSTGTPVVPGLTAANIVITNPIAQHVQVEVVNYKHDFILGNTLNSLAGMVIDPSILTLRASSVMRFAQ
ncbi:MAG: TadE/TadG family type IV pilus assembly protein [Methylobacter sp.]|nr:TadE/TadG family type IV pilus assembly protein [Methylobacter sp.]